MKCLCRGFGQRRRLCIAQGFNRQGRFGCVQLRLEVSSPILLVLWLLKKPETYCGALFLYVMKGDTRSYLTSWDGSFVLSCCIAEAISSYSVARRREDQLSRMDSGNVVDSLDSN